MPKQCVIRCVYMANTHKKYTIFLCELKLNSNKNWQLNTERNPAQIYSAQSQYDETHWIQWTKCVWTTKTAATTDTMNVERRKRDEWREGAKQKKRCPINECKSLWIRSCLKITTRLSKCTEISRSLSVDLLTVLAHVIRFDCGGIWRLLNTIEHNTRL